MNKVLNVEYLWDIDSDLKIWFSFGSDRINFNGGEYYFKTKHLNMFDYNNKEEIVNYLKFLNLPIVSMT